MDAVSRQSLSLTQCAAHIPHRALQPLAAFRCDSALSKLSPGFAKSSSCFNSSHRCSPSLLRRRASSALNRVSRNRRSTASSQGIVKHSEAAVLASIHGDNSGATDYSGVDTTNGGSDNRSGGTSGSSKVTNPSSEHLAASPAVGNTPEASFLGPVGEMLQRNKAKTVEVLEKLQSFGVAGVLSYGLFNTVYYIFAFLFVFLCVAPSPRGLGFAAAAKNFLKVFAVVWAGSQVTKLVRAGGALMLAPLMERAITALSSSKGVFKSRAQAVAAIVTFCFGLAGVLFLAVTALWA